MSNEETTPSEETEVIDFPIERLGLEEKVFYHCKACSHKITESMEKNKEGEKNKVLPLSLGPLMVYVCPNCYTLQLPEEMFKEILKVSNSKIIT
tara:strand:- start:1902 stop:2183 length:282 start_codon:yes stop_codon:yes gene_type:complete